MSDEDSTKHLLTLVITTSPTLSAPSTELLSGLLGSIKAHCALLFKCNVIVVFDACEQITTQPRLKKGQVTLKCAENYLVYKENVKKLFLQEYLQSALDDTDLRRGTGEAEYGSSCSSAVKPVAFTTSFTECHRVTFIEAADQRLGFGLAVRTALRMVRTPYTWVHQHDWALIYDIPVASLLAVMRGSDLDSSKPAVKYICLPSGRRASYAISDQVMRFPQLRKLATALTGDFSVTAGDGSAVVPLTPMFFWHDKPHIVSTSHYLERVFPTRLAMMRGAFIEDTIGQKARDQMKAGEWAKWATWQFNPDQGRQPCLKHLHGRTWRGRDEEARVREAHRQRNAAAMHQVVGALNEATAISSNVPASLATA
ncbi:hypothetical protein E4U42_003441 [Claviceps africana]|uniref:Uncharacterized protein n=1 Tax=Claviceps africana TaxID=83212 RepID=A0A8K0J6P6_9HYPO|nr:hypothetical protein E4U42_003441 [Claviceps africana]